MGKFEEWLTQEFQQQKIRLEEANLFPEIGLDYWHSTVVSSHNIPISGGFGFDRHYARKIALAEYLERMSVVEITNTISEHAKWGADLIPTACGFAAGFDKNNTILRALGEACERWVLSNWIDNQLFIEELSANEINLDPAAIFFSNQFSQVRYFKKKLKIFFQGMLVDVTVAQTTAFTEDGAFPGSSVQVINNDDKFLWQHSLLESYRHLLAIKNNPAGHDKFPANKVMFFSKNKEIAIEQIKSAKNKNWPLPETILERVESRFDNEAFIARIILRGWKSWHEGPIERFLY